MSVKGGKGKWDWAVTLDAGLTKPRSAWKGALEQILPVASCCMGPKWPHLCALISRSCQVWVSQEAHDLRWDNSGTKVDLEGADVWSCWSQSLDQDGASLCLPPKKANTVEQHTAVGNCGSIPLGTHWASAKNMPQDCPTKGWGATVFLHWLPPVISWGIPWGSFSPWHFQASTFSTRENPQAEQLR